MIHESSHKMDNNNGIANEKAWLWKNQNAWVEISPTLFNSYVTLGKLFNFLVPQFPKL